MNERPHTSHEVELAVIAQKMLMEAGHEPKNHWFYIDDLVRKFREQNAKRPELLGKMQQAIENIGAPLTRSSFKTLCEEILKQDRDQLMALQRQARLKEICIAAGITSPEAGHEALALRIDELEQAITGYAQQLKAREKNAARHKTGGTFPFIAGVVVGGILF